jgi:hypothetical protein
MFNQNPYGFLLVRFVSPASFFLESQLLIGIIGGMLH